MTIRYHSPIRFSTVLGRRIEGEFSGGQVTGNGGIQLLSEVDRRIGLTRSVAGSLEDPRRSASCGHGVLEMLRQRVYALALGEEDLNDHAELRNDLALRAAVGRDSELASPSTLCRMERRADRGAALAVHDALFERFVSAHAAPPKRLVLDFDATDTPLHGDQEGRFFHGYYGHYCYLPLYVFCGRHLLVSYLRPSGIDGARHAWAVLAMLVRALRARWPKVEIVLRADSGFCRHRMLRWCEGNNVGYVVGIGKNNVLMESAAGRVAEAAGRHARTGCRQKLFGSFRYAAASWDRERRVIVKAEHNAKGPNTRFVVTSLAHTDRHLYTKVYCARGDMENRIKNQQLDLFADRASCTRFWSNQFRQLLSGLAYTLIEALRRMALANTRLALASPNTIRLVLLRVGAVVVANTRRIRLLMSSAYPHQALFRLVALRLDSS